MKKAFRIILPIVFISIIVVCAGIAAVNFIYYGGDVKGTQPAESFFQYGECKGFFVRTSGERPDFPTSDGLGSKELKAELDAILEFAVNSGFKTVFFEARPDSAALYHSDYFPTSSAIVADEGGFTLFDPLAYLCKEAARRNLEIFAVVDAYEIGPVDRTFSDKNPAADPQYAQLKQDGVLYFDPTSSQVTTLLADSCRELAEQYPLSGIILTGTDAAAISSVNNLPALVWDALTQTRAAIDTVAPQKHLGLVLDGVPDEQGNFVIPPETVTGMVHSGALDLVLPRLYTTVDDPVNDYSILSGQWASTVKNSDARMVANLPVERFYSGERSYNDPDELGYQLFLNTLNTDISGTVFSTYGDLIDHPADLERFMSFLWESASLPSFSLDISQELAVRNPSQSVVLDNSYTKYYITGTSDPTLPLTMNGQEISRTTTGGGWGISVALSVGSNTFTFSQGDQTSTISLTRQGPATPSVISVIPKASIFPLVNRGYMAGDEVLISIIAPSGAKVSAQIGSATVALTQEAWAAAGLPATFSGTYTLPADLPAGEVTSLGAVTYTLSQGGVNTTYRSVGELLGAGTGAKLAVEVTDQMSGVYTDAVTVDGFVTSLAQGSKLYVTGEYEGTRAITELGGYINLSSITFLTGKNDLHSDIFDIFYEAGAGYETFSLRGDSPSPYVVEQTDTELIITLADASFQYTDFSSLEMQLFQNLVVTNDADSATLRFTLKDGAALWGYDLSYDSEGNLLLYCKAKPTLSGTYSRPLEGITVAIDPGHGGDDPGALGSAGVGGPHESVMNLAVASTLRYRLEQLGATVMMTRPDNDTTLSLQERVALVSQQKPDFFLSVHHNSTALTTDATEISAAAVYYCYGGSQILAKNILSEFESRVGRDIEPAAYGAYYVTRLSYAPAVLVETGYISNPKEQEDCCDSITVYKEACAIAQAVVNTLL